MKNRYWAGFLLAQFVLYWLVFKSPFLIKGYEHFFELQKTIHQLLFAWIPFSVGDVFYITLGLYIIWLIIKLCISNRRQQAIKHLLIISNIFYFIYQLFWGALYYQTPIIENLSNKETSINDAKHLAEIYLNKCRESRPNVAENPEGIFTLPNRSEIIEEIVRQQNHLPNFVEKKSTSIVSVKPSLFGKYMSYSGILGYYNPFTAEAQINANLPETYIPFTIAHESAHQLGFAREQEANFIAYLIGKQSKNPELKYATDYFVLKSLLNYLAINNEGDFAKSLLEKFSEPMKKDHQYEKEFREKHAGKLDDFFGITNDLFLKFNQQDGSITYSYFIDLLLKYELYQ